MITTIILTKIVVMISNNSNRNSNRNSNSNINDSLRRQEHRHAWRVHCLHRDVLIHDAEPPRRHHGRGHGIVLDYSRVCCIISHH